MSTSSRKASSQTRPERQDSAGAHTRAVVRAFKDSQDTPTEGPRDKFALALALMRRKHNREAMDVLEGLALHGDGRAEIFEAMAKAGSRCDEHTVAHLAAVHADRLRAVPSSAVDSTKTPKRPNRRIRTLAGESPTIFPPSKESSAALAEPAPSPVPAARPVAPPPKGRAFDRITAIAKGPLIATGIFGSQASAGTKRARMKSVLLGVVILVGLLTACVLGSRWVDDAKAAAFLAWVGLGTSDAEAHSSPALDAALRDDLPALEAAQATYTPKEARLAEALRYRFLDGPHPEPMTPGGSEPADVLIRALQGAPVERLDSITELSDLGDEPLPIALLAETLERAGDRNGAQNAYDRLASADRLPPHLGWMVAVHYLRVGRPEDAVAIRNRATEQFPQRAWTLALVALLSGRELGADAPLGPRVGLELFRLRQALTSDRRNAARAAREHLNRLGDIAGTHRLHVIMSFDALIDIGAYATASSVTAWEAWPRSEDIGDALEGALDASIDRSDLALPKLTVAWRQGVRDPRAARRLAELMLLSKTPAVSPDIIQEELDAKFPNSEEVALAGAALDVHRANYAAAKRRLDAHLGEIRRYAPPSTKGLAYGLLARASLGRGERETAKAQAERALRYDSAQIIARHVLTQLQETGG